MAAIEVRVELARTLSWLAQENRPRQVLQNFIYKQLTSWLDRMGIPVQPQIGLLVNEDYQEPRFLGFAVLVNGERCPYSKALILEIYQRLESQQISFDIQKWLYDTLSTDKRASGSEVIKALEFMAQVVVGAIANNPKILVNPKVVQDFLTDVQQQSDLKEQIANLDSNLVEQVLQKLLEFPISLRQRQTIIDWLIQGQQIGWSAEQIAERLYGILRPGGIEICLNSANIVSLLKQEQKIKEGEIFQILDFRQDNSPIDSLRNDLYSESGFLFLQHIYIRCVNTLPDRTVQYRINDKWFCPQNLQEKFSIDTLVLELKPYILSMADRLLSVEDTEFYLALYQGSYPVIVKAAYSSYSSLQITQVLRYLLKQKVSIRDFSTILELLLKFQHPYYGQSVAQCQIEGLEEMCLAIESVKGNLRTQITHQFSSYPEGKRKLTGFVLPPEIEQELLAVLAKQPEIDKFHVQALQDKQLMKRLFEMATRLVFNHSTPIVIVSTVTLALLLQDLIAADFPEIIILHRSLIEPSTQIESIKLSDEA